VGSYGSGSKENGEARGQLKRAGPAHGPRTRANARWARLGWLAARPSSLFPFSVFFFLDLNLNLVWVFEFKNGCTKLIGVFRYKAYHILLYILGIYLAILYINIGVVCYI
jgi:hypothetical protein